MQNCTELTNPLQEYIHLWLHTYLWKPRTFGLADGKCKSKQLEPAPAVTAKSFQSVDNLMPIHPLVLKLPEDLPKVPIHYVDFVKCEDVDTANIVKKYMEDQWSTLAKPGQKVKVKVKEELTSALVEQTFFISKLSLDCRYFYATAKANVRLPGGSLPTEYQFRDLILLQAASLTMLATTTPPCLRLLHSLCILWLCDWLARTRALSVCSNFMENSVCYWYYLQS